MIKVSTYSYSDLSHIVCVSSGHKEVLNKPAGGFDDKLRRHLAPGPVVSPLCQAQAAITRYVPSVLRAVLHSRFGVNGIDDGFNSGVRLATDDLNLETLSVEKGINLRRGWSVERPDRG